MARQAAEKKELEVCTAVRTLIEDCDRQTTIIKSRWRENYDMFAYGSQNPDKEEWQADFNIPKISTYIRTAQGNLLNTIINTPDWFELEPQGIGNQEAEQLAPAFSRIVNYYLDAAKFKRHAGTFFLCSLISSGNLYVGWTSRMVQNPEYVIESTEKARQELRRRQAPKVANPSVEASDALSADALEQSLLSALDEFAAEAQGLDAPKQKIPQYVQIGSLDLKDLNHERVYWDSNVMYMEDSIWRAFELDVNLYELHALAKMGMFKRADIDRIGATSATDFKYNTRDRLRYGNTMKSGQSKTSLVKLTYYFGPLIVGDEIKKERYYAIIANGSTVLAEGEYPYWEPPGHYTPVITAAVRQIPYRATGAGIGDQALKLQKIYDSNWQLVCDTFRFGISGMNVVNYANIVDKSQLEEGLYPGMTLHMRGDVRENFEHIDLTSNIENQAHPVQGMLEQAMQEVTGINDLQVGGANPYSRTAAAETNARLDAGQKNINTIALDLEQNFLIPALEKVFARVLQFGLEEIAINPELGALLTEEEKQQIAALNAGGRMDILQQWYKFKVRGFSSVTDQNAQAMRDNELLQIINSPGPLGQLVNLPEFMKRYFRNRNIKDPDKLLLTENTPIQIVMAENELLLSGRLVVPSQNDDHEFHLNNQMALAQSNFATPELQQHVQMHQQAMMAMQAPQQGQPQPGGQGPVQ